nr:probable arabinosyltransferase ARAD1 [Ipomoea batatas]
MGVRDTINRTLLCFLVFGVFLVGTLIYNGTIDYRSRFVNFESPLRNATPCPSVAGQPLKVYMYDLDIKYNVGLMKGGNVSGKPVSLSTLPPWPDGSGGLRRQHSLEYWMLASLLYEGDGVSALDFVRVSDPDTADAFFVPFFSSMSYNTYIKHGDYSGEKFDIQLQVEIVEFLKKSKYWKRSGGKDHVIPVHHPNAFKFHKAQVKKAIWIVADFGRADRNISNLRKDVVAPYGHVVESFLDDDPPDPFESRPTLLFFRGRTIRKDDGRDRLILQKLLAGEKDVVFQGSEGVSNGGIKNSTKGMRLSKFCLDPAGDTPSSCRLFDAIVSHCVPVIISDKVELPYEDEVDYSEFSIFISREDSKKEGYIVKQLRSISKSRWVEMWRLLKNISHHFEFQYPPKKGDAVSMVWRQVRHKLPFANLDVHRSRRLKVPDPWLR